MSGAWAWWQALWPQVYPNLIAAALQGAAAVVWARRHVRRIHRRFDLMHHHINEIKEGRHEPERH